MIDTLQPLAITAWPSHHFLFSFLESWGQVVAGVGVGACYSEGDGGWRTAEKSVAM